MMNQKIEKINYSKQITIGSLLVSTIVSDKDIFERSIVFITEQNENGYVGFIINNPFSRRLNELTEFSDSKDFRIFSGGPVDTDHLFFIHRRPDLIDNGTHIYNSIFLGGDFKQVVNFINEGILSEHDIKLFIGYCGWDLQQLNDEIKQGDWLVYSNDLADIIFQTPNDLWNRLYNATNK